MIYHKFISDQILLIIQKRYINLYTYTTMSKANMSSQDRINIQDSFIQQKQPNLCFRILTKIDVFSFIPVPKDSPVSTKQSLVGSFFFFALFLTYIIVDFIKFASHNPPIIQSFRTGLDDQVYQLPKFAIAFMNGIVTNETQEYNDMFNYEWFFLNKTQGVENKVPLNWDYVKYNTSDGSTQNFDKINWMSQATKKFYYILRTPTEPLKVKGLLYTSDETIYARLKLYFCGAKKDPNITCLDNETMTQLSNHGRIFLFIEVKRDTSSTTLEEPSKNGNSYLLYNFFPVQGFYKRVTINFQVIKNEILPDYLNRWSIETNERVQVESVFQELSVVTYNNPNQDAIAFNMQLSPIIINNRVAFSTLLDHVSMWGALWGVLFAVFALLFLSYNRKKFYKKNPHWDKFKSQDKSLNEAD